MKLNIPIALVGALIAAAAALAAPQQVVTDNVRPASARECPNIGASDTPLPVGTPQTSSVAVRCGTGLALSVGPNGSVSVETTSGGVCPMWEIAPGEYYDQIAKPHHRPVRKGTVFAQRIRYTCVDCDYVPFVTIYSCCRQAGGPVNVGGGKQSWDDELCPIREVVAAPVSPAPR